MAIGTFIFGQFATHRNYPMSLTGLFVIGSGLSLLQTASNPYLSIIGPIESAARRISIVGICNKIAGIISPLLISGFILTGVDTLEQKVKATTDANQRNVILNDFAQKIYMPYLCMAVVLLIVAIWIFYSSLPEVKAADHNKQTLEDGATEKNSIFDFKHLWLGAICIFVYVGAEVMAGDAVGTYGKGFNISTDVTKYFTPCTLTAMLIGYLIGYFTIPKYISQQAALKYSTILGICFSLAAFVTSGYLSVFFVIMLGLANATMWPAIFPLAINGLGKFTEKGSAILIMGIAGGAIIPKIFASLKEVYHFQAVFFVLMATCYLFILYYAVKGYKVGQKENTLEPQYT